MGGKGLTFDIGSSNNLGRKYGKTRKKNVFVLKRIIPVTNINELKNWCWRDRQDVIFVMEIMIAKENLELVRSGCGFDSGFYLV